MCGGLGNGHDRKRQNGQRKQRQVMAGKAYAERSEENRLRGIPIPAPRGTILDRYGEVVATSITAYSIAVLPGDSALVRNTLNDLAPFLALSASTIDTLMVQRTRRPHDLLEVTDRATFSQAAAIEERRIVGVSRTRWPARREAR